MNRKLIFFLFFLFLHYVHAAVLRDINISGNRLVSDKEIKEIIPVIEGGNVRMDQLSEIGQTISDFYMNRKLYNVLVHFPKIKPINRSEVDMYIEIEEFDPLKIYSVEFRGNRYFSTAKILELTKFDSVDAITFSNVNSFMEDIAQLYQLKGFLFIHVKLVEIVKTDQLVAIFEIDEGKKCSFKSFYVSGNKHSKENSILKFSGLQSLEHYTLQALKKAESNILQKEYILSCSITPINERVLNIDIVEGKMTKLSFLMGYDNKIEGSTSDRFSGNVDFTFMNLYGTDRSLHVHWENNLSQKKIMFDYHESGPFQFPVAGDFSFGRTEQDSTRIMNQFDTEIYYYTLKNKYGIYGGFDDYFPGSARPIIYPKIQDKKIGIFWEYSTLDNPINASSGIFLNTKYYRVFRFQGVLEESEEKPFNDQTDVIELAFSKYKLYFKNQVHYQSFHTKVTAKEGFENRYKLGGAKTIRGFTEGQFEGDKIAWTNQEWRYLLSMNSRAFLFLDYGVLERQVDGNTNRLTDLFGFGFGLRVETKLGLFGIDYGLSYNDGKVRKPADGILHFGIITTL